MARLPKVGDDKGTWGEILNDYLSQSLDNNGSLQPGSVGSSQIRDAAITAPAIADNAITEAKLEPALRSKVNSGVADGAITSNKLADNAVTPAKIDKLGTAQGVASLDGSGKLPEAQLPDRLAEASLNYSFVGIAQAAKNPDLLIVGAITRDSNQAVTSAAVMWPDGTPGTFTADTLSTAFPGAVDAYHITYGNPVSRTFTQPAITRNTAGAATTVPRIVES
jgi:hypothetical protein